MLTAPFHKSWLRLGLVSAGCAALLLATGNGAIADARLSSLMKAASEAERRDDVKEAIRRAEEAFSHAERVYGARHAETARAAQVLERLYRRDGRIAQADGLSRRIRNMQADNEGAAVKKLSPGLASPGSSAGSGSGSGGAPRSAVPIQKSERPSPPTAEPPAPIARAAPPPPAPRQLTPKELDAIVSIIGKKPPGSVPPRSAPPVAVGTQVLDPAKFAEVPVYFGTNRATGAARIRDDVSLATFTSTPSPELTIGEARVSVPRQGRDTGEIPRPRGASFWRAAEKENPDLHFTMVTVTRLTKEVFFTRVNARLAASSGDFKNQAFVFVHGFNVAFDDAVYRTAQIAYDLDFKGAPFVFSWPTLEGAFGYVGAKDRALASRVALRDFLDLVSQNTKAERIHLIAHSMGTWPLLDVLREISLSDGANRQTPRFNEVVLIAPDMDRDNFATLAARVCPARDASSTRCAGGPAAGMTFYATSNDRALLASVRLASGIDRAGLFDEKRPFIVKNIDTIDVSAADTSVFAYNHSQPLERGQLLKDIGRLLAAGARPPHARTPSYEPKQTDGGDTYWRYLKQ